MSSYRSDETTLVKYSDLNASIIKWHHFGTSVAIDRLIPDKKLLITCLQFLHNFVMKNEQRKLLLWLDLFANSKVANEYALPKDDPDEATPEVALESLGPNERRAEILRRASVEHRRKHRALYEEADQEDGEMLFGSVKSDRGDDLGALRTPQSAAVTLQVAKDQLMARLAEPAIPKSDKLVDGSLLDPQLPATESAAEDDDLDSELQEPEPGDQQRGLLTDIPLVLGPQEIEALPMIIQIGICPGLGSVLHGRDMQGMRCNILLAGDAGRNLLRELLIFIAAWDLQDDEIYFRLMMQIMEAILENGLMPYAYQTFSEVKDIVSPAQSIVIKILTQIFRSKQSAALEGEKAKLQAMKTKDEQQKPTTSRKVDIYIVRYIFTIFRSSVIPETCALIYLQAQIKAGAALPEDFPLNLWDMERVYEGVYQFLEFFAVLTESEEWKGLLVSWEIVSELVTLLRELEGSIPKAPINSSNIPQTVAEAQMQAKRAQQEALQAEKVAAITAGPAPTAVERPFDVPGDHADISDQGSNASNDPSDFEWRNLKKLVILVLSSLVWKSATVQAQIRQYGGVEMVLACCNYDANNPYIREHAVMCLRFLLEGSGENKAIVEKLQELGKMPAEEVPKP